MSGAKCTDNMKCVRGLGMGIVICLLTPATVLADASMKVNPGKWEIASEVTMPMMPQPMTNKGVECIKDGDWTAEKFMEDMEGECEASDVQQTGQTMKWTMRCDTDGGLVVGKGELHSSGNQMDGKLIMEMQGMKIKNTWHGKRLGSC
ncbi:DUF3617 family protein [Motiliproteus sp. MSK22-1]|uniref:DUF3617 domain-containing protein n=1 Tax=Motiliproteus sp. MSK22-1 TaxID=1897630 RepID=UPI000977A6DA|nr:DUF3617 family protein [Motiliproteus sp. MSK22-1]OMH27141.1 hypothetical protein BGP75_22775 [Motiliproteus sp. MSK22-1]